jgi:esterase/lipase
MNKEQAEKLAALMKKAGIQVHVVEGDSSEDVIKKAAKSFMENMKKQAEAASNDSDEASKEESKEQTKEISAPSELIDLASRVNLFVEHPMMVNLSTVETGMIHTVAEVILEKFVDQNPNFLGATTEESASRYYLNSIFYAVDIFMKAKAKAGFVVKPETTSVRIRKEAE